jgi:ferrous iron transport protein A
MPSSFKPNQIPTGIDVFMTKEPPETSCLLLSDVQALCHRRKRCGSRTAQAGTPLPETCCNSRLRVCAINGDRKICAKMANLGVLPGSELELLCKGGGRQCMIKVNGGTISLDAATAANILVAPA